MQVSQGTVWMPASILHPLEVSSWHHDALCSSQVVVQKTCWQQFALRLSDLKIYCFSCVQDRCKREPDVSKSPMGNSFAERENSIEKCNALLTWVAVCHCILWGMIISLWVGRHHTGFSLCGLLTRLSSRCSCFHPIHLFKPCLDSLHTI